MSRVGARFLRLRAPRDWPAWYVADLQTTMKGRRSWLPSRRRQAHAAVLLMIRWREAHIWPPDDLTADPTWSSMIVADAPPWSSMAVAALSPGETPPRPGNDWRTSLYEDAVHAGVRVDRRDQ